jgi:hypothetical protein
MRCFTRPSRACASAQGSCLHHIFFIREIAMFIQFVKTHVFYRLPALIACGALTCVGIAAQLAHAIDVTWSPPITQTIEIRKNENVVFMGDFLTYPVFPTDSLFSQTINAPIAIGTVGSVFWNTTVPGTYYFGSAPVQNTSGPLVLRADMKLTVVVLPACPTRTGPFAVMDIDGNGVVDQNTDGLLLARYTAGMRGDALTANAIGSNATRCTFRDIERYLAPRVIP